MFFSSIFSSISDIVSNLRTRLVVLAASSFGIQTIARLSADALQRNDCERIQERNFHLIHVRTSSPVSSRVNLFLQVTLVSQWISLVSLLVRVDLCDIHCAIIIAGELIFPFLVGLLLCVAIALLPCFFLAVLQGADQIWVT